MPDLLRTCVVPPGNFRYGIHEPCYTVDNLRPTDHLEPLGEDVNGDPVENRLNFPQDDVSVAAGNVVFEILNPFPFRGATYITRSWADAKAGRPQDIHLPGSEPASLSAVLKKWHAAGELSPASHSTSFETVTMDRLFSELPEPVLLALAATATDSEDLVRMARQCCDLVFDPSGQPAGLKYKKDARGRYKPVIHNSPLFETLANNPCLPDAYKVAMVLRPGVQGGSEIVGEWQVKDSHVFEYLRGNSYIPWGHYAANMAHDSIRYSALDLRADDIRGLRALYYQRTYVRFARQLGLAPPPKRQCLSEENLEALRKTICRLLGEKEKPADAPPFDASLWGWNYGFDFAPSRYRLHASHQQIHQQFAMIPGTVAQNDGSFFPAYSCGDLITVFITAYHRQHGRPFFKDYIAAIRGNRRMDDRPELPRSLIVYEDPRVMLFVPKAQTSQWELQLMTIAPVGNVLQADTETRRSLDTGILTAVKTLSAMGADMITTIEFSQRITDATETQHLIYSFLPKLPESPGAFSEAQLRFINGHYPEDFAAACRVAAPSR